MDVLSNPMDLPSTFWDYATQSWLKDAPVFPVSQVFGYQQTTNGCRVTNTSAQTLTTATETAITWDTETFDKGGMHSTAATTSKINIVTPGRYATGGTLLFNGAASGIRDARLKKNGTTYVAQNRAATLGAGSAVYTFVFDIADYVIGDYLELYGYQDSGGNLDVQAANCNFYVVQLA